MCQIPRLDLCSATFSLDTYLVVVIAHLELRRRLRNDILELRSARGVDCTQRVCKETTMTEYEETGQQVRQTSTSCQGRASCSARACECMTSG